MYRCGNCGKEVNISSEDPVRCPFCGYKILYKERASKVVKKIRIR